MMNRRKFIGGTLQGVGTLLVAGNLPMLASAQVEEEPALIYLSPIKTNGALSSCQAEVWYVGDGADLMVVTASNAWRAEALKLGLARTQIWVGDVGQWRSSDGAYLDLPSHFATASLVTDAADHARVLDIFGGKYVDEWDTWGPRFQKGLANGERVMLRYTPV